MDFTTSDHDAGASIESILYAVSAIIGFVKLSGVAFNQKKLNTNINAAVDDWLTAKDDKETWDIMKKYAYLARKVTLLLLYSAIGCFTIYISAIVMIIVKQIFFTDPGSVDGKNICLFSFFIMIYRDILR